MILPQLRAEVLEANLRLVADGLVVETFGNASGIDRSRGLVAIKPSGVDYKTLSAADLVITDLQGNIVQGSYRPSSDLATHLELYKAFPQIGGIAHTHSRYATAWAQARREIPCYGTTHADYFHGSIPLVEEMKPEEIATDYERNTGLAIVRRFESLNPATMHAALLSGHAPFAWGSTPSAAAYHAFLLEEIAQLALLTVSINPVAPSISQSLCDKHYLRKHGPKAYYGQENR